MPVGYTGPQPIRFPDWHAGTLTVRALFRRGVLIATLPWGDAEIEPWDDPLRLDPSWQTEGSDGG